MRVTSFLVLKLGELGSPDRGRGQTMWAPHRDAKLEYLDFPTSFARSFVLCNEGNVNLELGTGSVVLAKLYSICVPSLWLAGSVRYAYVTYDFLTGYKPFNQRCCRFRMEVVVHET